MNASPEGQRQIYLDYAATTPIDPCVLDTMHEAALSLYGNPSSLHMAGRAAKRALEEARSLTAAGLGAEPPEIIFTGGGSEADNLAVFGAAWANRARGSHLITSNIEHHAILHTCRFLETLGFEVSYLPVDADGIVQPDVLRDALRDDTVLVSIMHANNEIGTIQPIAELAGLAHERGSLFHTDAVQTVGQIPVSVEQLGVDLLTLSAHKFYGPRGIGALCVREGVRLVSLIHGGGQEGGLRAGTENVAGIVGAAKALELALSRVDAEAARLVDLRNDFWDRIRSAVPDARLNGHPTRRLPNNLNVSFRDAEAEGLLLRLSRDGIAASMGSACNSESIEPSHVVQAIGVPAEWERGTLRFTLGCDTTQADIAYAADRLIAILADS